MRNKLKIGLLINDYCVQAWEYDLVAEILSSEYSIIEAVIIQKKLTDNRMKKPPGNFLFRFHSRLDHLVFSGRNNYKERKDIRNSLVNTNQFVLPSAGQAESSDGNSDAIREISKLGLDIIVKLGYGPVNEELCGLSKYGLWSYPMTDCSYESIDTTGYFEVIDKQPVIVSELVTRMTKGQLPLVLARVTEATCAYSVSLTREKLFRRASLFVPRIIIGLWKEGPDYLKKIENKFGGTGLSLITQMPPPTALKSLGNFFKAGFIFIRQVVKKIIYTDPFTWVLLFQKASDNNFETHSYKDFKKLKPTSDRFWADPFVVNMKDKYYVFVEEFLYKANKGHIAVLELDKNGQLQKTQKIIENPYHMSYPFVFQRDSAYYMIPETGGNRSIDLYRCTGFPWKWEFVKSIMKDINAVDTTLLYHNGKWWLFTLIDEINSSLAVSPELYLFWSDDFLSDRWTGHPMNPVVTDVRYARPAGRIFIRDGNIYRPSQDCAGRYGNSFDINQILKLTCEDYQEKSVIKVKPDWDNSLQGAHTFNSDGNFYILDAYKVRRRLLN